MSRSKFLSAFLSAKRVCEAPPPVEIIALNDEFLREFAQSSKADHVDSSGSVSDSDHEDDIAYAIDRSAAITASVTSSSSSDIESGSSVSSDSKLVSLKMRNLPFNMTADSISKLVQSKLGLVFEKVTIDREAKTNRPAGTATLTLPAASNTSSYLSFLPTIEFGGRKVVVYDLDKNAKNNHRMPRSSDGRYFGHDAGTISTTKCHQCGEAGHKQAECMNDPLPVPCHLCAGLDHDIQSCPNVKCFRCGRFGHRSSNCVNYRCYEPVIVCSRCGSNEHETNTCTAKSKRIMDSNAMIRCVVCRELGHAVCNKKYKKKQKDEDKADNLDELDHMSAVYCPNCGQEGHHIDYAATCENEYCTVPKYEAHTRYSMLTDMLKDIDVCATDRTRSMRHLNNIYKGLISSIWSQSEYSRIQALFPSLIYERDQENAARERQLHPPPGRLTPKHHHRDREHHHHENRRKTFGGHSDNGSAGLQDLEAAAGIGMGGGDIDTLPSRGFGHKRARGESGSVAMDREQNKRRSATPNPVRSRDRGDRDGDSRYESHSGYEHSHFGGGGAYNRDSRETDNRVVRQEKASSVLRQGYHRSTGADYFNSSSNSNHNTNDLISAYKSSGNRVQSRAKGPVNVVSEVNMGEY